jgi:hypothetical protein
MGCCVVTILERGAKDGKAANMEEPRRWLRMWDVLRPGTLDAGLVLDEIYDAMLDNVATIVYRVAKLTIGVMKFSYNAYETLTATMKLPTGCTKVCMSLLWSCLMLHQSLSIGAWSYPLLHQSLYVGAMKLPTTIPKFAYRCCEAVYRYTKVVCWFYEVA